MTIKPKRTFHGKKQQQQKILLHATILNIPDFVFAIYRCYSKRKNGNNLTTSVKLKIDILTRFPFKMQKLKPDYACQINKDPNKGHPQIFLACLKTVPPIFQNVTSICKSGGSLSNFVRSCISVSNSNDTHYHSRQMVLRLLFVKRLVLQ